jgi:hypothetical protein
VTRHKLTVFVVKDYPPLEYEVAGVVTMQLLDWPAFITPIGVLLLIPDSFDFDAGYGPQPKAAMRVCSIDEGVDFFDFTQDRNNA